MHLLWYDIKAGIHTFGVGVGLSHLSFSYMVVGVETSIEDFWC